MQIKLPIQHISYLNKDKKINFPGYNFYVHMTRVDYRVGQRGGGVIDKTLADQCANG